MNARFIVDDRSTENPVLLRSMYPSLSGHFAFLTERKPERQVVKMERILFRTCSERCTERLENGRPFVRFPCRTVHKGVRYGMVSMERSSA